VPTRDVPPGEGAGEGGAGVWWRNLIRSLCLFLNLGWRTIFNILAEGEISGEASFGANQLKLLSGNGFGQEWELGGDQKITLSSGFLLKYFELKKLLILA
jgi:hypothetical protein